MKIIKTLKMLEIFLYWNIALYIFAISLIINPLKTILVLLIVDLVITASIPLDIYRKLDVVKRDIDAVYPMTIHGKIDNSIKAIYIYHPHGIVSMGAGMLFSVTERIRAHFLINWPLLLTPCYRHIFRGYGMDSASGKTVTKYLTNGESVVLCTGGAEESRYSSIDPLYLRLKKRTSYLRYANKYSVPIIPVLCPDENRFFRKLDHPFEEAITKALSFNIPIVSPVPYRGPIDVYVGNPIYPNPDIESYKQQVMNEMERISPVKIEWI